MFFNKVPALILLTNVIKPIQHIIYVTNAENIRNEIAIKLFVLPKYNNIGTKKISNIPKINPAIPRGNLSNLLRYISSVPGLCPIPINK